MTHYMELLATNQLWNLIFIIAMIFGMLNPAVLTGGGEMGM